MLVKWSEQETELGMIGRVGENNTRKIEIDCAETLEKLPGAEIICVMLRPGDETPYTMPLEANGNKRTIVLTDTDLERRGTIRLELRAVEGDAVLKSAILRGTVADSIRGEGDAPGQPVRDVLDRVDDTLKAAEATRKELETALGGLQGAVDAATGAADAATEAAAAAEETDAQIQAAEKGRVEAEKKREQDTAAAVQSITDTVADVQNKLESGAFDGKDGLDAPQIDDTTISDAAPWSSQHIVDMLCPPLEESGNPVVCYPVAGSNLDVKASWEPMQEGTGTPYPAGGGKNKLPFPSNSTKYPQSRNGLTATANADGSYTINGTATADTWFNICSLYGKGFDDFGAFALSGCPNGGSTSTAYYLALYTGTKWYSETGDGVTGQIDTLAEGAKIEISIKAGYVATNLRVWPQLEHGSTVTAYAPYANIRPIHGRTQAKVERCGENLLPYIWDRIPGQATSDGLTMVKTSGGTIHVTGTKTGTNWTDIFRISLAVSEFFELPAGTYSWGVGVSLQSNYGNMHSSPFTIDTPRIITGAYAAVNATGTYNKDYIPALVAGSELPTKVEPYQGESKVLTLPREIYGADLQADGAGQETWQVKAFDGTEDWLVFDAGGTGQFFYTTKYDVDKDPGKSLCSHFSKVIYGGTSIIRIYTDVFADVDTWKAYLAAQYAAGTPVQVAYKLATPVPFTSTGGGTIKALSGTNTILTDADAVTITGRADPIHIIQQLQAASTASAQALADDTMEITQEEAIQEENEKGMNG